MKQQPKISHRGDRRPRRIVGFSLSPELASEVKMEAARRHISLRELLIEMWQLYKSKKPA
jgi:hypothetical protein